MIPTFLAQYAAGCFLAVAASAIKLTGWRYLRLMCIVSIAIAMLALLFQVVETNGAVSAMSHPAVILLGCGLLAGTAWLFLNALQNEVVRNSQRLVAGAAGVACMAAALWLALGSASGSGEKPSTEVTPLQAMIPPQSPSRHTPSTAGIIISTLLGAALMGVATTAMLLGHRYLTDTDMPIAPLKWITNIYVAVILARVVWAIIGTAPLWTGNLQWSSGAIYAWLALSVRVGVGIAVAGVFAWMVWDCVKRRATQSATAIYYLSMLLIFFGELSAQYLMATEGLTL